MNGMKLCWTTSATHRNGSRTSGGGVDAILRTQSRQFKWMRFCTPKVRLVYLSLAAVGNHHARLYARAHPRSLQSPQPSTRCSRAGSSSSRIHQELKPLAVGAKRQPFDQRGAVGLGSGEDVEQLSGTDS